MLWLVDLTVAACHIQYTFLSLRQFLFVSQENGQNTKILEVRHFRMRARKALILRELRCQRRI